MKVRDIEGVKVRDGFTVDPRILKVEDGFNVRDYTTEKNKTHIDELCKSIKQYGVLDPITVRMVDDHLYVVSGHCRTMAVLQAINEGADIVAIPAIIEQRGTNEVDRTAQLMVHNNGRRLSQLEQGTVMKRLLAFGLTENEIADKISVSITHVKNTLKLMESPQPVLEMVREGKVSALQALRMVTEHGEEAVSVLVDGLQAAQKAGKKRITPRVLEGVEEPSEKRYSHTDGVAMVGALKEILASEDVSSIHTISKNLLESFGLEVS